MREQYKLIVRNMQDVKKRFILIISALLIALIGIITVVIKINSHTVLNANLSDIINNIDIKKSVTVKAPERVFNVKIAVDSKIIDVMSSGTVEDALQDAAVKVNDDDLINIGFSEQLSDNTFIEISRVTYEIKTTIETIEYATEYKDDENLTIGYSEVLVDGEEGEIQKVIKNTYIDGELMASNVLSQVKTDPVAEIVALGTKGGPDPSAISRLDVPTDLELDENGIPINYSEVLTGKSCAYSAKPTAKTASGRTVKVGYVAVDPNQIPYGTELYITTVDGSALYGYAIAADTGTALMDGRILVDLFMGSYDDSCKWGARQVNIYVLD